MAVYMVAIAQIPNRESGRSPYGTAVGKLVAKYGGKYVARGGPVQLLEGEWGDRQRLVISRWPDLETVNRFWNSKEYQEEVKPLRDGMGIFDVGIFEEE